MAYYAQSADIARLAMDVEDAGWQFYRKLAGVSEDKKVKELFTYLSDQEAKHKIIFGSIVQEVQTEQENEYVIDVISEMQTGIRDIKKFIFPSEIDPSAHIDIVVAIQIAIHAEDESIRVYTEMKRVLIDRFSNVLTKVITEEQNHREILLNLQKTFPSTV
jgi:rubrerythrin